MFDLLEGIPESFNWLTLVLLVPTIWEGTKRFWIQIQSWIFSLMTFSFTVTNDNSRFFLYRTALTKLVPKARRMREVDVPGGGPAWMMEGEEVETDVQPDHGNYWLKFEGIWVRVNYFEHEVKEAAGAAPMGREQATFSFFTRDRGRLGRFRSFVYDLEKEKRKLRTTIWTNRWGTWVPIAKRYPRGEGTLFYEDNVHHEIRKDLYRFLGSASSYREQGRVHKRGYIFHGPPGNGKTTLILWLAAQIGMDVAIISSCTDDETFLGLVTRVPRGAILLLEDVDSLFASSKSRDLMVKTKSKKSKKSKKKADESSPVEVEDPGAKTVSLSVLLNYLDGMLSREGQIVFMTTNYFDRIDAALIRQGRADRRLKLGGPSRETVKRMFETAYPGVQPSPFLLAFGNLKDKPSVADLEGLFDRFGSDEVTVQLCAKGT
jgi:chaperone BCS1